MKQQTHTPWEYILLAATRLPPDHQCRNEIMNTLERARLYANAVVSPKEKARWQTEAVDAIDPHDIATERWMIARLSEFRRATRQS